MVYLTPVATRESPMKSERQLRTSILKAPAEEFYASCNAEDRAEIVRIVGNLCADPKVNNRTVFVLPLPPVILSVYRDARFWIAFRLPNGNELEVLNIGRPGEREGVWKAR